MSAEQPEPIPASFTRLEQRVAATPEQVWEAWTTAEGIASWWSPDGFETTVDEIDVREGGALVHTMTAVGEGQIAFLEGAGLPLSTTAHKRFTEVGRPARLAYVSRVDFVPDADPYDHLTVVDLAADGHGTLVTMGVGPMHDDVWQERMIAGRTNELANLAGLFA